MLYGNWSPWSLRIDHNFMVPSMPLVSLISKLFTHSSCGNAVFAVPELSPDWTLYSTRAAISRSPTPQCTQAECAHRTGLFQLQPLSHHSSATPTSCEGKSRSSSRLLNCFLKLTLVTSIVADFEPRIWGHHFFTVSHLAFYLRLVTS